MARPPNCPKCGKMAGKGHKCKKRDELPIPPTRAEIEKEKKNRAEIIRIFAMRCRWNPQKLENMILKSLDGGLPRLSDEERQWRQEQSNAIYERLKKSKEKKENKAAEVKERKEIREYRQSRAIEIEEGLGYWVDRYVDDDDVDGVDVDGDDSADGYLTDDDSAEKNWEPVRKKTKKKIRDSYRNIKRLEYKAHKREEKDENRTENDQTFSKIIDAIVNKKIVFTPELKDAPLEELVEYVVKIIPDFQDESNKATPTTKRRK